MECGEKEDGDVPAWWCDEEVLAVKGWVEVWQVLGCRKCSVWVVRRRRGGNETMMDEVECWAAPGGLVWRCGATCRGGGEREDIGASGDKGKGIRHGRCNR